MANRNCCRQAPPMDTNVCESKYKKQNICIVSKYLPTRYLLFTKRKNSSFIEKPGKHHFNQVMKVNVTGSEAY